MCAHHSLTCTDTNLQRHQPTLTCYNLLHSQIHRYARTHTHTHEHSIAEHTFSPRSKFTEVKGKEGEESANRVKIFSLFFLLSYYKLSRIMQRTTRSVRSKVHLSMLVVYFVLSRQQRSGERNCPSHLIKVTVTVISVRGKNDNSCDQRPASIRNCPR